MDNKLKKKKSEIIEIILVAIAIALGINLVSSSIIELFNINNIVVIIIGITICISVISYYVITEIKSMNINKNIDGNIILNPNTDNIYKIIQYHSSVDISDTIRALMLEDSKTKVKYKNSIKSIEKYENNIKKLNNEFFGQIINDAIEYQIINTLTDAIGLKNKDVKTIELNNAPKEILNNMFVKTLSKDYKKRIAFKNDTDIINDGEGELVYHVNDDGYMYNKLEINIPKNSEIKKNGNSLILKSRYYKMTIEWGVESVFVPILTMNFYNFFLDKNKVADSDVEISYYINVKVKYNLLTMFSRKSNRYYSWIDYLINTMEKDFDYEYNLKNANWDLLDNISNIINNQNKKN